MFTDAVNELIALEDNDPVKALKMALAYMSGCHKEAMTNRSVLSGQENFITYQITMQHTFHGVGLVWNILRKFCPEQMTAGIMGMRALANMQGAVFDVPEDKVSSFEDIFEHAKDSGRRLDFEISKCETLPDLLDNQQQQKPAYGAYNQGF